MKFEFVFKQGIKTLAIIKGTRELTTDEVCFKDVEKAIEFEHWTERILGVRVHVQEQGE